MCVTYTSRIKTVKDSLIVYKIVQLCNGEKGEKEMISPLHPNQRGEQTKKIMGIFPSKYSDQGTRLVYEWKKEISSSFMTTPGLYCLVSIYDAMDWADEIHNSLIMECVIPAGAKYRLSKKKSWLADIPCIQVETLIPLREKVLTCGKTRTEIEDGKFLRGQYEKKVRR